MEKTNLKQKLRAKLLKSMREWPPAIDYAMKVAKIDNMQVGEVRILIADVSDMFKFLIPHGLLVIIMPVRRCSEDEFEFYDSDMNLVGIVVQKFRTIYVYGDYLTMKQERWGTTQFIKDPVYYKTLEKVKEQFPDAVISRHEVV